MSDINSIPARSRSRPILGLTETNKILQHLRNDYSIDNTRSQNNSDGKSVKAPRNENLWANVKAHEYLPKWAVFTIESIASYRDSYPYAKTKQIDGTETYKIYLTNEQYETASDVVFFPQIIGTHRPQKVIYEGDKPVTGDKVGVVPNSYTVSKSYTGLIAFSDGDEANNYVWVVKDIGAGSQVKVGFTTINPGSGSGVDNEYPIRPANTFWVEEAEILLDEETQGWRCRTLVPNGSFYLVHDLNDAYHEENDEVMFIEANGRYYMAENPEILFKAKLTADLCSGDSAQIEQIKKVPEGYSVEADQLGTVGNLYEHRGKAGQEVVFMQNYLPDQGSGSGSGSGTGGCIPPALEHNVIEIKKRPICVVNGIKDSEACLYYGTLSTVLEWCPGGEKPNGCTIFNWYDCEVGSGSGSGIVCSPGWDLIICDSDAPGSGSGSGSGNDCDCCPTDTGV